MRFSLPETLKRLKRFFRPEEPRDPDDPYALVGAPKKPRPPLRHSSVAREREAER